MFTLHTPNQAIPHVRTKLKQTTTEVESSLLTR